jgi:hypothetical protein
MRINNNIFGCLSALVSVIVAFLTIITILRLVVPSNREANAIEVLSSFVAGVIVGYSAMTIFGLISKNYTK